MERDQIIWLKDDDDEADETVPDDEELSGINAAMSSNRAKADLSIQVSCNSDSCHKTILNVKILTHRYYLEHHLVENEPSNKLDDGFFEAERRA